MKRAYEAPLVAYQARFEVVGEMTNTNTDRGLSGFHVACDLPLGSVKFEVGLVMGWFPKNCSRNIPIQKHTTRLLSQYWICQIQPTAPKVKRNLISNS